MTGCLVLAHRQTRVSRFVSVMELQASQSPPVSDPGLLLLPRRRRGLRGGLCAGRLIRERIGQELADNLRHLRRGYEIVVTVARHDRQPRLRQLRVQPAG